MRKSDGEWIIKYISNCLSLPPLFFTWQPLRHFPPWRRDWEGKRVVKGDGGDLSIFSPTKGFESDDWFQARRRRCRCAGSATLKLLFQHLLRLRLPSWTLITLAKNAVWYDMFLVMSTWVFLSVCHSCNPSLSVQVIDLIQYVKYCSYLD